MNQIHRVPQQTNVETYLSKLAYCPRNSKQDLYISKLEMQNRVVVGFGAKCADKSSLALQVGLHKLMKKQISKIIVTNGNEKDTHLWILPMLDILQYYYSRPQLQEMLDTSIIEFLPLTKIHNRCFDDTWLMCDEAQHLSKVQTTMMLTQLGANTKVIFTANPLRPDQDDSSSGLNNFIDLMNSSETDFSDTISIVEFDDVDSFTFPTSFCA
jgi:phosphate starvation-inducible protein PhoH